MNIIPDLVTQLLILCLRNWKVVIHSILKWRNTHQWFQQLAWNETLINPTNSLGFLVPISPLWIINLKTYFTSCSRMEMQKVMQEKEAWPKSNFFFHATSGAGSFSCVCLTKDFRKKENLCKPGQHLKSTKSSSSVEWHSLGNISKNILTCFFG